MSKNIEIVPVFILQVYYLGTQVREIPSACTWIIQNWWKRALVLSASQIIPVLILQLFYPGYTSAADSHGMHPNYFLSPKNIQNWQKRAKILKSYPYSSCNYFTRATWVWQIHLACTWNIFCPKYIQNWQKQVKILFILWLFHLSYPGLADSPGMHPNYFLSSKNSQKWQEQTR